MLKKCVGYGLLLIVGLFLAGCATLADAKAGKGTGEARIYAKPLDTVWMATLAAIKASDLELVSEDKANGTILAQRSMTLMSYGENVAIFIDAADAGSTQVEVVNKRTMSVNITAANWASRLFAKLDESLGDGQKVK